MAWLKGISIGVAAACLLLVALSLLGLGAKRLGQGSALPGSVELAVSLALAVGAYFVCRSAWHCVRGQPLAGMLSGWVRRPMVSASGGRCLVCARRVRWIPTVAFSLFSLLGTAFLHGPRSHEIGIRLCFGLFEAATLVLTVRAARSSTLLADDSAVVVRSVLRTRRWPRREIRSFSSRTQPIGNLAWPRQVLGLEFADGSVRWLSEINGPVAKPGRPSWIDAAAVTLSGTGPAAIATQDLRTDSSHESSRPGHRPQPIPKRAWLLLLGIPFLALVFGIALAATVALYPGLILASSALLALATHYQRLRSATRSRREPAGGPNQAGLSP